MRPEDAWNQFMKTGSIEDYMEYRRTDMLLRHLHEAAEDEWTDAGQDQGNHSQRDVQWGGR